MDSLNMKAKMTQQFLNGLKEYGYTYEDLINQGWCYCGSENNLNYFNQVFKNCEKPLHVDECVCHHKIKINCYITNKEHILIVGKCCINKFIPEEKRRKTCEVCEKPQKYKK